MSVNDTDGIDDDATDVEDDDDAAIGNTTDDDDSAGDDDGDAAGDDDDAFDGVVAADDVPVPATGVTDAAVRVDLRSADGLRVRTRVVLSSSSPSAPSSESLLLLDRDALRRLRRCLLPLILDDDPVLPPLRRIR